MIEFHYPYDSDPEPLIQPLDILDFGSRTPDGEYEIESTAQ